MRILALDTSTPTGSIALLDGDRVLPEESFESDRSHNAALFGPLRRALKHTGDTPVDALLSGIGPGSYTGVRIGLAAAHGLAFTRGWKHAGWTSFAALSDAPRFYVTGDARRRDAFLATVEKGRLTALPEIFPMAELTARLAPLNAPVFTTDPAPPVVGVRSARPSAARLARAWVALGAPVEDTPVTPIYLRAPSITTPRTPPVDVVCAVIMRDDGRFLAARRPEGKRHAGQWEFPGGKIEPGEDPKAALHREIDEELATTLSIRRAMRARTHNYGDFRIRLHPFLGTLTGPEPTPAEHAELQWVSARMAPDLDWTAADLPIVREVCGKMSEFQRFS